MERGWCAADGRCAFLLYDLLHGSSDSLAISIAGLVLGHDAAQGRIMDEIGGLVGPRIEDLLGP